MSQRGRSPLHERSLTHAAPESDGSALSGGLSLPSGEDAASRVALASIVEFDASVALSAALTDAPQAGTSAARSSAAQR